MTDSKVQKVLNVAKKVAPKKATLRIKPTGPEFRLEWKYVGEHVKRAERMK